MDPLKDPVDEPLINTRFCCLIPINDVLNNFHNLKYENAGRNGMADGGQKPLFAEAIDTPGDGIFFHFNSRATERLAKQYR